jgi:hypothetical protein
VELSYNSRGFFVSLFSISSESNNKILEIENQDKINQILAAFNHDYGLLAQHIKIVKGHVKIRRPENANN